MFADTGTVPSWTSSLRARMLRGPYSAPSGSCTTHCISRKGTISAFFHVFLSVETWLPGATRPCSAHSLRVVRLTGPKTESLSIFRNHSVAVESAFTFEDCMLGIKQNLTVIRCAGCCLCNGQDVRREAAVMSRTFRACPGESAVSVPASGFPFCQRLPADMKKYAFFSEFLL